jgi:hypothetical protein
MTDSMFEAIPDCSVCGPSLEDAFPITLKCRRSIIQGEYLKKESYSTKNNANQMNQIA